MSKLYDKTGREIMRGDIVKVFHFVAALRRKKHYMYKQCLGVEQKGTTFWMRFSHLDLNEDGYWQQVDGSILDDYEIVQSIDAKFEDRPRFRVDTFSLKLTLHTEEV